MFDSLLQDCGVKGPSGLMCLRHFDLVWGTSVEYVYCIMLGVVKTLLSLWADPAKCRGTLHDIEPDLHLIDPPGSETFLRKCTRK